MNIFPYITVLLISLIVFSYPQTLLSQEEKLAVVASVRGTALSVDFDLLTGVVAVDLGEGNVAFVGPGANTTLDMGAGNVVRVEVPDSGAGGGVLLNVVSGDIEVRTPTGDAINMDTGDGVQVSETEAGGTAVSVTATGEDGGVTVDTNAGAIAMDVGDVVEVGEIGTDGSVEVTVTGGEATLAIDAGDVTMDVGDAMIVTEGMDGVGMEIISGEVTLETGTGYVVMDAGDNVIISLDSESGNAEIRVVGGDGVDVVDADTGETVTVEVGGNVEVQTVVNEGDNEGQADFGANVMGGAEAEAEAGVTDEGVVFTTDTNESDITASYVSDISESSNTYTYADPDGNGDGIHDSLGVFPNDPDESVDSDRNGVDVVDADTGETVTVEVGGNVEVQIVVNEGDNEGQADFGANVMGGAEAEAEAGVTDEGVVFTTDTNESDITASYVSDISESSNTYTYADPDGNGDGIHDSLGVFPNDPVEDRDDDGGSSDDDSHEDNGIHRGNDKEDRHKDKDKGKHKSEGKKKHDFAGLIDNIVDPQVASTGYLLTFAKMIRGDMDTNNEEYSDDAASQSEHQVKIDEVINDINTSIIKPSTKDIFDSLRTARDSLMIHEDTKGYAQHVGIAHHLLDSKIFADDGVEISLNSIEEEMDQAKVFLNEHINDFGDTTAHNDIRSQIDSVLAKIDTVNNNNYTAPTISSIKSEIKKAFCDTIDHMHGHENNPFEFCHHNTDKGHVHNDSHDHDGA